MRTVIAILLVCSGCISSKRAMNVQSDSTAIRIQPNKGIEKVRTKIVVIVILGTVLTIVADQNIK